MLKFSIADKKTLDDELRQGQDSIKSKLLEEKKQLVAIEKRRDRTYFVRNVMYSIFIPLLVVAIGACFAFPPAIPGAIMLAAISFAFGGMICEMVGAVQDRNVRSIKSKIEKLEEKEKVIEHNIKLLANEQAVEVDVETKEGPKNDKIVLANFIKLESALVKFFLNTQVTVGNLGSFSFKDDEVTKLVLSKIHELDAEKLSKDLSEGKLKGIAGEVYGKVCEEFRSNFIGSSYLYTTSKDAVSADAVIKIQDSDMQKLHRMLDKQTTLLSSISK